MRIVASLSSSLVFASLFFGCSATLNTGSNDAGANANPTGTTQADCDKIAEDIRTHGGRPGVCASTAPADVQRFGTACASLKDCNDKVGATHSEMGPSPPQPPGKGDAASDPMNGSSGDAAVELPAQSGETCDPSKGTYCVGAKLICVPPPYAVAGTCRLVCQTLNTCANDNLLFHKCCKLPGAAGGLAVCIQQDHIPNGYTCD